MIYSKITINDKEYEAKASFLAYAYFEELRDEYFELWRINPKYEGTEDDEEAADKNGNPKFIVQTLIKQMEMMFCCIQAASFESGRPFELNLRGWYIECSQDARSGQKIMDALYKEFTDGTLLEELRKTDAKVKKNG